jgi:hypothetical protein
MEMKRVSIEKVKKSSHPKKIPTVANLTIQNYCTMLFLGWQMFYHFHHVPLNGRNG